jgi:glycosyltransferase involved in cell wall biosynthesis
MKIAYVTYEYPPDTPDGGIATYVRQAARVMAGRGHRVEVFAASRHREGTEEEEGGIVVHRVLEPDWGPFNGKIAPVFERRHGEVGFDVLEGPDHLARAEEIVRRVPGIPLVLKLHTPQAMLRRFDYPPVRGMKWVRTWAGALRRGKRPWWYFDDDPDGVRERRHAREADELASPSTVLGGILSRRWGVDRALVSHVPNPFVPAAEMLAIPVETRTNRVTYVGRLEILKGMVELTRAIPAVLARVRGARFRIVGRTGPRSPVEGMSMVEWMRRELAAWGDRVEFVEGGVPPARIPAVLAETDVCVVPSRWDNFPNVCLEAMAAGRGVVGTRSGGMVDMLEGGWGVLVGVNDHRALAGRMVEMLGDPDGRMRMGAAARRRVVEEYNGDRVGKLMEDSYGRAIARRRAVGERRPDGRGLAAGDVAELELRPS